MREVIYSGFSHHLYTIKARKWWSFKTSKWSFEISNRRRRFLWFNVHCNRLTFVLIVSSLNLYLFCRVRNESSFQMISKTTKSFSSNVLETILSLRSHFLNFFSRLRFLFHDQSVHAKVTLSSDRTCYRKYDDDRWEWLTSDVTVWFSFSERKCSRSCPLHNLFSAISYCLSSVSIAWIRRTLECSLWSSFLACLAEVTVRSVRKNCL
jgi:hypothetical protein